MKAKEITKTVIYLNKHERKIVRTYNDIFVKLLQETKEDCSVIAEILTNEEFRDEEDLTEGD